MASVRKNKKVSLTVRELRKFRHLQETKYRHRVVFSQGTGRVTQRQNHFTEQNKRGFHFHHPFRKGKEHFAPETEFILSDYDERPQLSQNDTLFLKDDYEAEKRLVRTAARVPF